MFLLTEATLFFLDLALKSRIRDKDTRLCSVVQSWVDGVAAATTGDSADHAYPTVGAIQSSTSNLPNETTPFRAANDLFQTCALSRTGEATMRYHAEVPVGTSRMVMVAPSALKRKIDDTDIISRIELHRSGDDSMDIPEDFSQVANVASSAKRSRTHTPSATSVGVMTQSPMRSSRESRHEGDSVLSSSKIAAAYRSKRQISQRRRIDNEGCIVEATRKCSEPKIRNLPIPCDQRWSHSFISTAILWYSVQDDIWNVPEEVLVPALQRIFNVVYPGIDYMITPNCSVFAVTLQRIREWRNSFGSSALAMILHFFSTLDDNDIHHSAEFLATDYRFLCGDPDASEPTEMFRSAFLTMLIAATHLGDISAFVNVPGWDTPAIAAGKGGEGVIAIASAAVERAIKFFCDGTLDVDHVLAEMAVRPNATVNVKAVLDALAAHDALAFSSANWSNKTATYREAVGERGTAFVQAIFAAARQRRVSIRFNPDEGEACASEGVVPDPRALL